MQEYEHKEYPSNGFLVHCSNCSVTENFGDECDFRVYGTGTYWKDTSVCCGAMHDGKLVSFIFINKTYIVFFSLCFYTYDISLKKQVFGKLIINLKLLTYKIINLKMILIYT